jgi:hypothetical protein
MDPAQALASRKGAAMSQGEIFFDGIQKAIPTRLMRFTLQEESTDFGTTLKHIALFVIPILALAWG